MFLMMTVSYLNCIDLPVNFCFFPTAVNMTLERSVYEVDEGMPVSVCVNLTGDIAREVEITIATFSSSSTNTASGEISHEHFAALI